MTHLSGRWIVTRDARFLAEEVIGLRDRGERGTDVFLRGCNQPLFTGSHYKHITRVLDRMDIGFLKLTIGKPEKQENKDADRTHARR